METLEYETICALSTPVGLGAIAVIRISGSDTFSMVSKLFFSSSFQSDAIKDRYAYFGKIRNEKKHIIDEVLLTCFRAPHSYTGEDMAEISCHGSIFIVKKIMELLLDEGCVLAEAGAFTQRAFLNGKMDLTQAEAVMDLISSHSEASHRLAMDQMRGGYTKEIEQLRSELLHFSSMMELELDFGEEDVEFVDREELKKLLKKILDKTYTLKSSFSLGNVLKNGIPVAIVGNPNVGKSTLLNALLNEERAIVSHIPGTTRDTIEESMNIEGITFRFVDTAGLRHSDNFIENIGIERTYQAIGKAYVALYVFDIMQTTAKEVEAAIESFRLHISDQDKRFIVIANKLDELGETPPNFDRFVDLDTIFISAKRKENIGMITDRLVGYFKEHAPEMQMVTSNLRHYEALSEVEKALNIVKSGLEKNIPTDLITLDLNQALYHLGSITGQVTNEEILSNIFSRFCIGK
ncbi:MAG: tRNA uridine-5-carboxymethylaminomethyl(34) synthesis GTPase MnmE [Bacteroidales bacterium]|jgi:tRNA modification GTPase|nr:tRNA uridine-5-carboxymethylaminomethyl(34) synthesis GTPase MnmE [Bacteroidales bacterium]